VLGFVGISVFLDTHRPRGAQSSYFYLDDARRHSRRQPPQSFDQGPVNTRHCDGPPSMGPTWLLPPTSRTAGYRAFNAGGGGGGDGTGAPSSRTPSPAGCIP